MLVLPLRVSQDGLRCTLIYMYIYIYICVCVCVCACVCLCVSVCVYVVYIYIYIYCVCVCVCGRVSLNFHQSPVKLRTKNWTFTLKFVRWRTSFTDFPEFAVSTGRHVNKQLMFLAIMHRLGVMFNYFLTSTSGLNFCFSFMFPFILSLFVVFIIPFFLFFSLFFFFVHMIYCF